MRGVIVGANARQEWLLSWWWEHYHRHNSYPVTFADFGMSESARRWCCQRGTLMSVRIPPLSVKDRSEVDAIRVREWEDTYPDTFWESRNGWFRKPQACLQTLYDEAVWIDLDCEIVKPIDAIFDRQIRLARDGAVTESHFPIYNTGVMSFTKNHPLIVEWVSAALEKNAFFRSDQDLLSSMISEKKYSICELDPIYNWSVGNGRNPQVVVYHWLGEAAKRVLQNKLILSNLEF